MSFAKQGLFYALLGGTVVSPARITVVTNKTIDLPVKLVGMSPEDMFELFNEDLYPSLQADLVFLRRVWHSDPDFFDSKFRDAVKASYGGARREQMAKVSVVKGMLAILNVFTNFGEVVGTAATISGWIGEAHGWTEWLTQGRRAVLEEGQEASLRYISDATMGNLWEAMLNVNAVQLVPAPGVRKLEVFGRKTRGVEDYTFPRGAVLTPLWRGETRMTGPDEKGAIFVAWEDGDKLKQGWVRPNEVTPSLYQASSAISILDKPGPHAHRADRLGEGEIFAVTRNVQDGEGRWWMELSDGRGYVREDSDYTGPVQRAQANDKEELKSRAVLKAAHTAHKSLTAQCARLAFNVGMFAGGFFTGGVTWTIGAAVNVVDVGGSALMESQAMSDLDMKMEYLVMQLRSWELQGTSRSRRCHITKDPCRDNWKCIRELAFYDVDFGKDGSGWCMRNERPVREDGQVCLVHADCMSGNCEPAEGCRGLKCIEATCKPFGG